MLACLHAHSCLAQKLIPSCSLDDGTQTSAPLPARCRPQDFAKANTQSARARMGNRGRLHVRRDLQARMDYCACCVADSSGQALLFFSRGMRIVGAPATCLLLYIYAGMDVRLRPALGSGTTLVDQMRPALRWRYRCLKFPSRQANEGNEFRDRADEKLSVVETSAGAVRTSSPQEPRSEAGGSTIRIDPFGRDWAVRY